MNEDGDRSDYINLALFIPLSTLLKFITPSSQPEIIVGAAAEHGAPFVTKSNVQVKWKAWLPDGSRMFVLPNEERVWVCNVYGSRFIYALESSQSDGEPAPRRFAVMDFNSLYAGRAIAAVPDKLSPVEEFPPEEHTESSVDSIEASHAEWSRDPTTIAAEKYQIFTQNVTTSLPFQQSYSRNAFVFDGLLLTEDNVLLVKASHIHLHGASNFVL